MKKLSFLVMMVVLAAVVQAVPIFEEDFTGETKQVDTTYYGCRVTAANNNYNTWYMGNNGILPGPWLGMTDAFAQVKAVSNTAASRSAAIAIDGTGIAAGTYTVSWDFGQYNNSTQFVQVWDCDAGTGAYILKYADPTPVSQVILEGDASATLLGQFLLTHLPAGALTVAGQTLDFVYDGTGDIGLQFGISAETAWEPLLSIDNISITKSIAPQSPAPTGTIPSQVVSLTWGAPDISGEPNIVSVDQFDVYYYPRLTANVTAEDPNWLDTGVVTTLDTTSGAVSFTADFDTTYFCRIDTTYTWDVNDVYPTYKSVKSTEWSFDVLPDDIAPIVTTTYNGVITWDAQLPVTLTATVDDDGEGDVSLGGISWTITGHDSGDPSLDSLATLTNTTVNPLSPSATFTVNTAADPNAYGQWLIELTVADAALQTGTDTTYVIVREDACEARKRVWDWQYVQSYYDVDDNCVVDILDLAAFAAEWLDDVKLDNTFYYFN